jgi:hypothetical protein
MVLKDLANKGCYTANGFIESLDSFNLLEGYILYNLPVLKQFKHIVIVNTYKEYSEELVKINTQLWNEYFSNVDFIDLKENRGHSFGIADSENALIEHCQSLGYEWICKSSNDVLLQEKILNKEIKEADLYYFNGISYEDLYLNNFDYKKIYDNHFYPQTNFYFIRVDKIDYLYDKKYIDETYQYRLNIPNYSNKIWEYIPEWSCENFLKKCVSRNRLSKEYLLDLDTHNKLCETIKMCKIGDPSHKNIMYEGVCHFQYPEQNIIEI